MEFNESQTSKDIFTSLTVLSKDIHNPAPKLREAKELA